MKTNNTGYTPNDTILILRARQQVLKTSTARIRATREGMLETLAALEPRPEATSKPVPASRAKGSPFYALKRAASKLLQKQPAKRANFYGVVPPFQDIPVRPASSQFISSTGGSFSSSRSSQSLSDVSIPSTPSASPPASPRLSPLQTLIKKVRTLGQWGGEPELVALSKSLGRPIRVWQARATSQGTVYARTSTYNEHAGTAPVDLAYSGVHYNALTRLRTVGADFATGVESPAPADGDCLFHAVAEAASLPYLSLITEAYQSGHMAEIRQDETLMAMVDHPDFMTDRELYHALRQNYVVQLRYDAARELGKPEYEAMARNDAASR